MYGESRRYHFRYAFFSSALLVFSAMMAPLAVVAQEPTENGAQAEQAPDEREPEAPEKVEVQPLAQDEQIQSRLQNILNEIRDKTDRFSSAEVSVEDGVVYLSGEATEEEYRTWAGDLARNTQDVVAVVNRMNVKTRSVWDMSPAIAELNGLWRRTVQMLPLLLFGLIAVIVTWLIARGASRATPWATSKQIENKLLRDVVSKAAAIPVIVIGLYIVLQVFDLTQLAMTVVGGTGLAGLIIGIAFRDIAENLLASVLISVQNPFRSGDLIEINEHLGIVQRVTTRGTVLMTFDGNHVQIPNSTVYKNTIVNYSANPNRRVDFEVGIGYDDSATDAQAIVLEALEKHPAVLDDPPPRVLLCHLGASTVNLRVYFWVNGTTHNWETIQSSLMRIIKQSLQEAGISLPDEAREVIFPNGVPVRMLEQSQRHEDQKSNGEARLESRKQTASKTREEVILAGKVTWRASRTNSSVRPTLHGNQKAERIC